MTHFLIEQKSICQSALPEHPSANKTACWIFLNLMESKCHSLPCWSGDPSLQHIVLWPTPHQRPPSVLPPSGWIVGGSDQRCWWECAGKTRRKQTHHTFTWEQPDSGLEPSTFQQLSHCRPSGWFLRGKHSYKLKIIINDKLPSLLCGADICLLPKLYRYFGNWF